MTKYRVQTYIVYKAYYIIVACLTTSLPKPFSSVLNFDPINVYFPAMQGCLSLSLPSQTKTLVVGLFFSFQINMTQMQHSS